jgi:hypothetical protein
MWSIVFGLQPAFCASNLIDRKDSDMLNFRVNRQNRYNILPCRQNKGHIFLEKIRGVYQVRMKGIEGIKDIKSMGEIESNKGIKKQAGFEKLWIWQEANALT